MASRRSSGQIGHDRRDDVDGTSEGSDVTSEETRSSPSASLPPPLLALDEDAARSLLGSRSPDKETTDPSAKKRGDIFSPDRSRSGPSSLSSAGAPVDSIRDPDYPDEERVGRDLEIESESDGNSGGGCSGSGGGGGGGGGGDSSSSAPSPTGPNSLSLKSSGSPCGTIGRNSWLRTSLRRTSPSTAGRQRQLGSNALASQLYRSGSFNSSGRGSTCDAVDDMYSDVSLEDDVIDLNHRVRMIQEQMHALTDTHSVGEERYARVKQENATLQARILMLEEAAKDAEARAEEKLEVEQRRHREWACRLEREKQLQLENWAIKMQTIELECSSLRDQVRRLREQLDSAKEERGRLEGVVEDTRREMREVREAERQALLRSNEARVLLDAARNELAARTRAAEGVGGGSGGGWAGRGAGDETLRVKELEARVAELSARNKSLEESRDELQAAAALHAGRELLMLNLPRSSYDPLLDSSNREGGCSLAAELSADAIRDTSHRSSPPPRSPKDSAMPLTVPELRRALKEQQEVNAQLRSYIDGILLNIVENYPQLLEVKQPNGGGGGSSSGGACC